MFKMSVISGVISRQVLPVCGSLCFFCPALRARSRQPVKRYKKLIADIFPRNPEEGPNDRKIGKLCEYAGKNPLRIPKITTSLEQRCYKELRNENFQAVKVVMSIYRKLLVSCKEQIANGLNHVFWCLEIAPVNICRFWVGDEAPRKKEMRQKGMNLLDFVFEGYQLPTS